MSWEDGSADDGDDSPKKAGMHGTPAPDAARPGEAVESLRHGTQHHATNNRF